MSYASPTNGDDWLDALNWGTSAETTSTLGDDRKDTRVPPSFYHIGNLQIARMKNLLLSISQYLAGGNRVRILPTSGSQFASGEYGFQVTTNVAQIVRNGGTPESIAAAAVTTKGDLAVFNGTNWVRVGAGTAGQVLTADPSTASGVKWA